MKRIVLFFIAFFPSLALGQADLNALTFVGDSTETKSAQTGGPQKNLGDAGTADLDSGRYVKRKKHISKRRPASESEVPELKIQSNLPPIPAPELQNTGVEPLPRLSPETFNNNTTPQPR